jgi:hypothetical protein
VPGGFFFIVLRLLFAVVWQTNIEAKCPQSYFKDSNVISNPRMVHYRFNHIFIDILFGIKYPHRSGWPHGFG